jgi:chromate transport protein ChrA
MLTIAAASAPSHAGTGVIGLASAAAPAHHLSTLAGAIVANAVAIFVDEIGSLPAAVASTHHLTALASAIVANAVAVFVDEIVARAVTISVGKVDPLSAAVLQAILSRTLREDGDRKCHDQDEG